MQPSRGSRWLLQWSATVRQGWGRWPATCAPLYFSSLCACIRAEQSTNAMMLMLTRRHMTSKFTVMHDADRHQPRAHAESTLARDR